MKRSLILIIAMFCTSCLVQMSTPTEPQVEIAAMESTEDPTIATPDCQPGSGVTFRLQKISDNMVELIATGLQPAEATRVFYSSTYNGRNDGLSGMFDANLVNENGEFYSELSRLDPVEEKVSMTWDIRLQHSHGVECATIILP
jgi:hypothetical protein